MFFVCSPPFSRRVTQVGWWYLEPQIGPKPWTPLCAGQDALIRSWRSVLTPYWLHLHISINKNDVSTKLLNILICSFSTLVSFCCWLRTICTVSNFSHSWWQVGVPTSAERADILLKQLSLVPCSATTEELTQLADTAHGYVGADLAAVCKEAGK